MPASSLNHGFTPLNHWGMIFVEGPDAAALLQSQLSNSVLSLKRTMVGDIARGPDSVRLVGYCSKYCKTIVDVRTTLKSKSGGCLG